MGKNKQKDSLTIYREDMFTKLKKAFKKLFNIEENNEPQYNAAQSAKMRLSSDKENSIFTTQRKFERGEIKEEDLSEVEVLKMAQLYNEQIKEIDEEIKERQKEIKNNTKLLNEYYKKTVSVQEKQIVNAN